MQIHNLVQGTPSWHKYRAEHFNASDAPAMLGLSPYKTRSELLREMATGMAQEIDAATQRRFDDGHRFEALARPLAEKIAGEDLYPVVGSEGKLSASFDGLTMDESIIFEHKSLNDEIRAAQTVDDLGAHLHIQMEQQLMICGAEKCLFMATKWDADDDLIEAKHFWYTSKQEIRTSIVQGWCQFAEDLENYVPVEVVQAAVAAPTKDLPALSIQVKGAISLVSNLDKFGAMLNEYVAGIDKEPVDDQGFADAEAAIKTLQKAQDALESAESSALAQTADIDDMRRTVKLYADTARTTRLMLEKMVKSRKESIRFEITQSAKDDFALHVQNLNVRLGKPYMPSITADFAGVMKGKKTISSLRDAVATEMARVKIEANAVADKIEINLNTLREIAKDHAFLFADTANIIQKSNDDLVNLINSRINEHKADEAAKAEAMRIQIAEEERIKAEAKARAEQQAAQKLIDDAARLEKEKEAQRVKDEHDAAQKELKAAQTVINDEQTKPATAQVKELFKTKVPASATEKKRPSDAEIIEVLSSHYRVHEVEVIKWLIDMDLEEASADAMEEL